MKNIITVITALIFVITSFVLGARYGAEAFIQADAKFNASLITAKLLDLENNNTERLKKSLEFDRDVFLIRHGEGEGSFLKFLWPELNMGENKELGLRALNRAATYRKAHPTQWSNPEMLESFEPQIRSGIIEQGRILEETTQKYAQ
nr:MULTISPECIES: hypothetical protein [unclassified Pseudomonas]